MRYVRATVAGMNLLRVLSGIKPDPPRKALTGLTWVGLYARQV